MIDLEPILGYYLTADGFKFANISHNPFLSPGSVDGVPANYRAMLPLAITERQQF
ncbi:MAG: hypothetical protein KDE28_22350 [Anaerolineales bacterium]|nr:hypothetical protein [Anaerolineales bacterium]